MTPNQRRETQQAHEIHHRVAERRVEFMRYDMETELQLSQQTSEYKLPEWLYMAYDIEDIEQSEREWQAQGTKYWWENQIGFEYSNEEDAEKQYFINSILQTTIDDAPKEPYSPPEMVHLVSWLGYEKQLMFHPTIQFCSPKYYSTWHQYSIWRRANTDVLGIDYMQMLSLPKMADQPQIQYYLRYVKLVQ